MKNAYRKPLGLPQQLRDELQLKDSVSGSRHSSSIAAQRKQLRKTSRVQKRPQRLARNSVSGTKSKFSQRPQPLTHPVKSQISSSQQISDHGPSDKRNSVEDARFSDSEAEDAHYESSAESETSDEAERDSERGQEPRMSRGVRDKLAEEDAEIAALERKLGKRGKKKNGMESLLGELGELGGLSESEDDLGSFQLKRKHDIETEEWLRSKRRKAARDPSAASQDRADEASDSFEGFEDSDNNEDNAQGPPKTRENPYVAPIPVKYVPPSLRDRNKNLPDDERLHGLRRQVQGLLNRLSEANMVDIVKRIDQLFGENPRNDISSVLIGLLMASLADRAALNDIFIILHAGFTAALYRVVGIDFGAKIVQDLVERCDSFQNGNNSSDKGKQESNLISFLAELYNFQVIGSKLIYDFIRVLTEDLSESSTELLLRIVRSSGQELRQDDPSSLKDVVLLLQESIRRVGESNLSVRTKFMIETITNLKNNRVKTGQEAASIKTEHTMRMKKTLASMSSMKSISIKTTEPIRAGLDDIRSSQSKGKWWLVGASFRDDAQLRLQDAAQSLKPSGIPELKNNNRVTSLPDEGNDADMPDIGAAARSLGMNTDIRRAIFIGTMTAASIDEAYVSLMKLSLNKRQTREFAIVLARCAAAEQQYNPFYALLARKLSSRREVRKTLWNPLLEVFSQLDQEDDDNNSNGNNDDDNEGDDNPYARWWSHPQARFNLSRFYGALIAHEVVSLLVLKNRNVLSAGASATSFLELLLIAVILAIGRHKSKVRACFDVLRGTDTAASLRVFLERTVAGSDLAGPDERSVLKRGCSIAVETLRED